jgi:small subunit ribosomal protein S8
MQVKKKASEFKSFGVPTTDPIADMLTRIRNSSLARHEFVQIPASKMKLSIAKILKEEGFITEYEVLRGKPQRVLKVILRYDKNRKPLIAGLKRVSKPGIRVYVDSQNIPRIYGGLGISILSTSKGLMTGKEAWRNKIGGELLCNVW